MLAVGSRLSVCLVYLPVFANFTVSLMYFICFVYFAVDDYVAVAKDKHGYNVEQVKGKK